jgi:CHAT domain-containing protein
MRRPRFWFPIRPLYLSLCTFIGCLLLGSPIGQQFVFAQISEPSQLVQLGVDQYRNDNFSAAIAHWQQAYPLYEANQDLPALAIVSENLARAYQQMGDTTQELVYWQTASTLTQQLGDTPRLGRLLTEQAQAHSRLGQHRRAIALLCGESTEPNTAQIAPSGCIPGSALAIAEATASDDPQGELAALGSLGEAYRLSGNYDKARAYLQRGEAILTTQSINPTLAAALFSSLGNTFASLAELDYRYAADIARYGDPGEAQTRRDAADKNNAIATQYFENSLTTSRQQADRSSELQALLSLISAYDRGDKITAALDLWPQAVIVMQSLPVSQTKALAALTLADQLDKLNSGADTVSLLCPAATVETQMTSLLSQAQTMADQLQNPRILSFALGKLAHLDERCDRIAPALEKNQKALWAADQSLGSQDSLYLWQWQQGRLLKAQGNRTEALHAYKKAITLLETLRKDIASANLDLQFNFRDTIEPLYRQYAELNLSTVPDNVVLIDQQAEFEQLDQALISLDALKVAELQSYFASDCIIIPSPERVDQVATNDAAIFSTAILSDQLAVIASFPNGSKQIVRIPVSESALNASIQTFRRGLQNVESEPIYNPAPAQQVYQWLIEPFEAQLAQQQIKTLVFVNDGLLRSIPMAALHDGQGYLVERFAIATIPSLTLTEPTPLDKENLNALVVGLSEPSRVNNTSWNALPSVDAEITNIANILPTTALCDQADLCPQKFTVSALEQALAQNSYQILHMATHGQFGYQPENNFLITAELEGDPDAANNRTLTISELDAKLRQLRGPNTPPIELLTLSACETAAGDNRATLGLAGVALRAGVRSAVASLWPVNDEVTAELIEIFYQNLRQPDSTRAQALQAAQQALIARSDITSHPYYWAPWLLIGNWL